MFVIKYFSQKKSDKRKDTFSKSVVWYFPTLLSETHFIKNIDPKKRKLDNCLFLLFTFLFYILLGRECDDFGIISLKLFL